MNADDFSLDELASAYLDNEVTPDERARAEADPEVMARVAEFRSMTSIFAENIADERTSIATGADDMIARALGLFDNPDLTIDATADATADVAVTDRASSSDDTAEANPAPAVAPVIPMTHRSRRRSAFPWTGLAVAAAVLGGVVLIGRSVGGESRMSAESSSAKSAEAAATTAAASADATFGDAGLAAGSEEAAEAPAATEAAPAAEATDAAIVQVADAAPATIDSIQVAGSVETTVAAAAPAPEATEAAAPTVTLVSLTDEAQLQAYVTSQARDAGKRVEERTDQCLGLGVAVEMITWQGAVTTLYLSPDAVAPTSAQVVDANCTVLVSVAIGP